VEIGCRRLWRTAASGGGVAAPQCNPFRSIAESCFETDASQRGQKPLNTEAEESTPLKQLPDKR
jgi:hypothetical protein